MTVSQDRPPLSRRRLRDDTPAESPDTSADIEQPDAAPAAEPPANLPQRTPGGRRVRWDPSASNVTEPPFAVEPTSDGSSDDGEASIDARSEAPVDHAPAHQAATTPDLPSSGSASESAPVRAPIRPRAGRRSSFAPSFPGSTPPAASAPDGAVAEAAPTTNDASTDAVPTTSDAPTDAGLATDELRMDAGSGRAEDALADDAHPVTGQLFAPERTMTRRELRALRARAEAEGRPAPDVIFLPDGGSAVTGAIDIIDPAEARRICEEATADTAISDEVRSSEAGVDADATDGSQFAPEIDAADVDSTDGSQFAPETDAAGVVTEEPVDAAPREDASGEAVSGEDLSGEHATAQDVHGENPSEEDASGEVVEDAVIVLDDERADDDSNEQTDDHDSPGDHFGDEQHDAGQPSVDTEHEHPVADEAGVVTEESVTDEPDPNEHVDSDDGVQTGNDVDSDDDVDSGDRTPVIPALIEPPETGSIRFLPDPNAPTPAEIVVDAEPLTGETAPVRDDEPAPGPSSLRPFDAMFLPPSARDTDGTEIDTSSLQPVNDTHGLRGDILAAPEGAARPFGHWSTQDGGDDELAIDSLLSRDIGVSTGAVTTHALVLPSIPDAGEPLLSPLTSTGEVMVTGSVDLPRSYGSTGAHPALFDHPDVDALIDDADREDADSGVAPVRATRAVSSTTTTQAMIGSESVPRSRWIAITAIVIGGVVLVAAASWAIAAIVFNAF